MAKIASLALAGLLALASTALHADAFVPSTPSFASRSASSSALSMAGKSLVVVSPPGGVGEVAAVAAAKSGNAVRWFVVNAPMSKSSVALPSSTLEAIEAAGGKVELAGADSDSLLLPPEDAGSAAAAVGRWCGGVDGGVDGLIVTSDGAGDVQFGEDVNAVEGREALEDAVKVAAREAAGASGGGVKVAVLPAPVPGDAAEDEEEGGGLGGVLGSLLGGAKTEVPASLGEAVGSNASMLRYGELFGLPETSPEASPFVGGPRRGPVLREEYTLRGVRVNPTISASGAAMMGSAARSSRLSVGEAAALVALGDVDLARGSDVCLTSLSGAAAPTSADWDEEFQSVKEAMASGAGAQLFKASFASVPDVERLADWLATKWAPAVLRTYDIAGIRIGARPVYASRAGPGKVEIVWQKLENFESLTVGSMILEVNGESITAERGAGDPGKGYGKVSMIPLNGEDVLVRRLADAASQAVEKGLANKAAKAETKKPKPQAKVVPVAPAVSTVAASGTVESAAPVPSAPATAASEAGPRAAGARRSSERTRGRRRKAAPKKEEVAAPEPSKPEESPEAFQ